MKRLEACFAAVALFAALAWNPVAARAADICITDAAKQNLAQCPNNGPGTFTTHGKAPALSFHTAPQPADLKKREQQTKPNMPSEQMSAGQRDDRKSRLQQRAKGLLIGELQGLEQLLQTTPANSPDRLQLVRRLAEDYVELENAGFTAKTEAEIKRDELKKTNPTGASQQQALVNQASGIMLKARAHAIQYYSAITTDFPNYPQLDEVLYYLAYEYEQGNDNANARTTYYKLIQSRPNSKYIPNAYLAFGELFFNEAQGDPSKWPVAQQAYQKVIGFPPPDNKVYGYAWYKLAYVLWNSGDFAGALSAFKHTIDYGTTFTQIPGASKLADSARRDIIPVYALKGDPSAAYNFFHNLSGDPAGQSAKTFLMMDELGNNYLDTGHYPEAIALYRDLLSRDRGGDKTCVYQAHITEATMAMKSGNKDGIKVELDKQVAVEHDFKAGNHPADAKQECANKTAALLTETAMAWHLEAVGTGGQRGTGDQRTMDKAAYIYKKVVDSWTQQEFSAFVFPRILKEDWPNIYKIKYAMADLLYFQQRWASCGPAFDAVVAENPQAPEAAEAAYASVLCYQNIYDQTHKGGSDRKGSGNLPGSKKKEAQKESDDVRLAPKEFTDSQKGMITAFNRYICYIHPAANDAAGQDQLVEVQYARARTYFEGQHWEEAASAFREIAMTHADKDVGIYAAQLYLESVNVLGAHSKPPRISCFNDMAEDVPKFLDLYCTGDKLAKNQDQCTTLTKIQCDIQRLKAQKLTEKADSGVPDALADGRGGRAHVPRHVAQVRRDGDPRQPAAAVRPHDEIVYNAAKAYQAARLLGRAISTRHDPPQPGQPDGEEPARDKAIYEIGGNFQAIAVYDQAANWYEKYADLKPAPEKADVALSDAVQLRLGLGQAEEAIKDATLFRARFGASKPTETAAIQFAIGAHYASIEAWDQAKVALQGAMGLIDRSAVDIQLQAHATLANVYTHQRDGMAGAASEYGKVRAIWANPDAAVAKLNAAYPAEDQGQRNKRLAKALTAVGEALFFAAEEHRRADVETIRFPEYHGNGKKDDVLKHVNGKVADWMKKKAAAIVKVEAEYKKIVDLQPEPPPRWVIAAGSRVGLLWGGFVDDFRRAPYPKDWDKKGCAVACGTADELSWGEIKANYFANLDGASQPFKDGTVFDGKRVGAKPALVACLDYSLKYQYFDQFSRDCEVWLAKNYK